ncbi:MAG: hypothetical protein IJT73_04690 [Selenomonadaceae bacterium]|nr:hypothetical protein [Selenomonadaceae bacterium]
MKVEKIITKKLSFAEIKFEIKSVGEDILILVTGGDKPHIGSAVLAIPRPSLRDDTEISCTSSVLNVTGHKDEKICRYLAETFCRKYNAVTICTGGFHCDNLTAEQIQEVINACKIF